MKSLRIVCFLAKLNGLKLTGGNIGNTYLEACTKEKVCFRAGPEFGSLEGCLMVVDEALHGLRSSGAGFHVVLSETPVDFGILAVSCGSRCLDAGRRRLLRMCCGLCR